METFKGFILEVLAITVGGYIALNLFDLYYW